MPVYEYRCAECATSFEKLVPLSSNGASIDCPRCGGKAQKLLSVFSTPGVERASAGGGCCGRAGACACAG